MTEKIYQFSSSPIPRVANGNNGNGSGLRDLSERVSRIETHLQYVATKEDIRRIEGRLESFATREDLRRIETLIEKRVVTMQYWMLGFLGTFLVGGALTLIRTFLPVG